MRLNPYNQFEASRTPTTKSEIIRKSVSRFLAFVIRRRSENSSIVYLITVIELTGVGTIIGTQTYEYVSTYIIIAIIYLATTLAIVKTSRAIEYRTAIPGLTTKNQRF